VLCLNYLIFLLAYCNSDCFSAVMCGNVAQRVNSLCFIQRSIKTYSISLFLALTQSLTDTNRLTNPDRLGLFLSLSLSLTNRLRTPVYMWLNLNRQHTSTHPQPNKVRNVLLSIGFAGDQAYLHLALHSSGSDWPHH